MPAKTMIYVHVAENHRREIPEPVLAAAAGETDPDRRILKMLAARGIEPDRNTMTSIWSHVALQGSRLVSSVL